MDLSWMYIAEAFYFVGTRLEEVICDFLALRMSDISAADTLAKGEGVLTPSEEPNRYIISVDTL